MKVGEKVKEFFHKEGIHSTTIQLEFNQVIKLIFFLANSCYYNSSFTTEDAIRRGKRLC